MPAQDGPDAAPTDHAVEPGTDRVESRAQLLPEEQAVGSDDPQAQAEVILADSEQRTEVPNAAPAGHLERRRSEETT